MVIVWLKQEVPMEETIIVSNYPNEGKVVANC